MQTSGPILAWRHESVERSIIGICGGVVSLADMCVAWEWKIDELLYG